MRRIVTHVRMALHVTSVLRAVNSISFIRSVSARVGSLWMHFSVNNAVRIVLSVRILVHARDVRNLTNLMSREIASITVRIKYFMTKKAKHVRIAPKIVKDALM